MISTFFSVRTKSNKKKFRKTSNTDDNKKRKYKSNSKQLLSHYVITLTYFNNDYFMKNSLISKIDELMHIKIVISAFCS